MVRTIQEVVGTGGSRLLADWESPRMTQNQTKRLVVFITGIVAVTMLLLAVGVAGTVSANTNVTVNVTDGTTEIADAQVALEQDGSFLHDGVTNASGQHTFSNLSEGDYTLYTDRDGYFGNVTVISVGSDDFEETIPLTGAPAAITGQVVNNSSGQAINHTAWIDVKNKPYDSDTNASGYFHIDVPEDNFKVTFANETFLTTAETVDTTGGDVDLGTVELVKAPSMVTGQLQNSSSDSPIPDGWANALEAPYATGVNDTGHFTLYLANDTYTVLLGHDTDYIDQEYSVNTTETDVDLGVVGLEPMPEAGTLTGTVTNETASVPGALIEVAGIDKTTHYTTTTTDENGSYSLDIPADTYWLQVSADGYGNQTDVIQVNASQTTTKDITVREPGTLQGTISAAADGQALEDVTINVGGPEFDQTTTDKNGDYSLQLSEGSYEIEVNASAYADEYMRDITVDADDTTTVDVSLHEPAYIEGVVNSTDGNASEGAFVLADDGTDFYFAQTNTTGYFNISASAGSYRLDAFHETDKEFGTADGEVTLSDGEVKTVSIDMRDPNITHTNVTEVTDTLEAGAMDHLGVETSLMGPFITVNLLNQTAVQSPEDKAMPYDLTQEGANASTEFEISITVEDFNVSSLVWGVRDVDWETTDNASGGTDITITTKSIDLQGISQTETPLPVGPMVEQSPQEVDWPTGQNDKADIGWSNAVYFGLMDLSAAPPDVRKNLDGMTISTNAQAFTRPQVKNDTLRVYVAGPHLTTDGSDHDGFYEAHIPDTQLDAWGIDDPENELQALYKGDSQNFDVTETDDGAWIELDISYSDGTIEVAPNNNDSSADSDSDDTEDDSESDTTDSGGSTSFSSGSSTSGDDDTEDDADVTDNTDNETDDTEDRDATDASHPVADDGAADGSDASTTPTAAESREESVTTPAEDPDDMPGFGVPIALIAILLAVLARRQIH